eukprot:scaffold2066_cov229-Ochromonas_danica.AAC.9
MTKDAVAHLSTSRAVLRHSSDTAARDCQRQLRHDCHLLHTTEKRSLQRKRRKEDGGRVGWTWREGDIVDWQFFPVLLGNEVRPLISDIHWREDACETGSNIASASGSF